MIESILQGFEVWTNAQGVKSRARVKSIDNISLEGIAQLRELILELAIRGKLIPQNPEDKPASVLLKDIEHKKKELLKEKTIRKQPELSIVSDDEKNFVIPESWVWTRLGNISFQITDGAHHTPKYTNEGIPFLSVKDVSSGIIDFTNTRFVSIEQHQELIKRCHPEKGDMLLTKVGTTGIPVLIETDIPFSIFVSIALIKFANDFILGDYLSLLIKSPLVKIQSKEGTEGIGNKNLVLRKIWQFKIVIPPFEEQNRIVHKVNELMSLCDKLEEQQTSNLSTHQNLVKSLLETLTNAVNDDELQVAWEKLSEHFDTLFYTEDSVEQLRQTILELVIAGRFKTQRENDTPAPELYSLVEAELTEKFGKQYSTKLKRDASTIDPSEFHFPIHETWLWCELQDLAILFNGKAHEQFVDENGAFILVNSSFVSSEGKSAKYVSNQLTPLSKGNIAIVMSDVPGGKALVKCFFVKEDNKYSLNQRIGGIEASSHIDLRYLFLVLNRNRYYLQYDDGRKQSNLKKIQILSCPIPLPPFEEQGRIVAKANELLESCELLSKRIVRANEINQALSKTIVEVIS